MSVNIHGKTYVTVAERIQAIAKDHPRGYSLVSEVLQHDPVLVKATLTVHTQDGDRVFTGHSAANPMKSIEKQTPYEVAESSAWGRALAAAAYGTEEGIASADEMVKPAYQTNPVNTPSNTEHKPYEVPLSEPQRKKIMAMLPQTRYDSKQELEEVLGKKVEELSKSAAMVLIKNMQSAIDAKLSEVPVTNDDLQEMGL